MTKLSVFFLKQPWLWLVCGAFGLAVLYANPFLETSYSDDWTYALTVRHLVETGSYKLHDWSTANIIFPAYWGALFVAISGYSFGVLKFSTVVLSLAGLVGFYYLAKEHDFDNTQAGLLTLCLLSCPFVVLLSFTFMTDIPFLSLLILALLFYTRGLKRHSYPAMLVGSIAASLSILTRQTGLALPAALFLIWIFNRERRLQLGFYLTGLLLPSAIGVWQVFTIVFIPNQGGAYYGPVQRDYMLNPGRFIPEALLWRPAVFLHYLAFFLLPLVVLAMVAIGYENKSSATKGVPIKKASRWAVRVGLFLFLAVLYTLVAKGFLFMPYLPWNLDSLRGSSLSLALITFTTFIGAMLFGSIFYQKIIVEKEWKSLQLPDKGLLNLTSALFLVYFLFFFLIGDRYIMAFLPFMLLLIGRYLKTWLLRARIPMLVGCLGLLLVSSIWARGIMAADEAAWRGGEYIRTTGVNPTVIYANWVWYSYYNFETYLTENNGKLEYVGFVEKWHPDKADKALYRVVEPVDLVPVADQWQVITEIPYQDGLFQPRHLLVIKKK